MNAVAAAGAQFGAELLQRPQPVVGAGTALGQLGRGKGALEQVGDRGRQGGERQGVRRRFHLPGDGVAAKGEAAFADGPLDGHVALAPVAAGEGVAAHEQQVEAQQGQAEGVVIRRAPQPVERLALQFRRGELRHADIAGKQAVAGADLERVAIDQLDQRLGRDHHVAGIDVADDVAAGVNRLEGAGQVAGGVDQKRPVGLRERLLAMRGAVEAVDFPVAVDPGHDEALHWSVGPGAQHVHRPGGDFQQAGMRLPGHVVELERLVRADGLVIDLGDEAGPAGDLVDRALAATPQCRSQFERVARAVIQLRHRILPGWRAEGGRRGLGHRPGSGRRIRRVRRAGER